MVLGVACLPVPAFWKSISSIQTRDLCKNFFSAETMLMSMCKGFMGVLVHLLGFCRNPGYF